VERDDLYKGAEVSYLLIVSVYPSRVSAFQSRWLVVDPANSLSALDTAFLNYGRQWQVRCCLDSD